MRLLTFITDYTKIDEAVINVTSRYRLKKLDLVKKQGTFKKLSDIVSSINTEYGWLDITFHITNDKTSSDRYGIVQAGVNGNQIHFFVNDSFLKSFNNDYINMRKFYKSILEHEMVHIEQTKRIDFSKYKTHKDYGKDKSITLSNKQEIMSYAKQISVQLLLKYNDPSKVMKFLRQPKEGISSDFDMFIGTFGKKNRVINRLYKYIYEYIIWH